jgi:hypothetical protein
VKQHRSRRASQARHDAGAGLGAIGNSVGTKPFWFLRKSIKVAHIEEFTSNNGGGQKKTVSKTKPFRTFQRGTPIPLEWLAHPGFITSVSALKGRTNFPDVNDQ